MSMQITEEKGILQIGRDEIVEKKSRFLGEAYPVRSIEEAEAIYDAICRKYWDASHHVYAWRIRGAVPAEKASDDGEPARTAGFPILSLLQSEGLENVLVVVTRYFGGTLLGTGGLVRAYTAGARAALDQACIIEKKAYIRMRLEMEYTLLGKTQYILQTRSWDILSTSYEEKVVLTVLVPVEEEGLFVKEMAELSGGTLMPVREGQVLAARAEDQWYFF